MITAFNQKIRVRGPIYKGYKKLTDKTSNPHWYVDIMSRSYLLRGIQLFSYFISVLSPTENVKVFFTYEKQKADDNEKDQTKCHERHISAAFVTELMTLHSIVYVSIGSIFYSQLDSRVKILVSAYIMLELIILFDRITYQSFLKFVFHPERRVHNIGRSIILFVLNYIYIIISYTIIYQNELIVFNIKSNMDIVDYWYFSVATITTLGYGDLYPETVIGKVAVITQALFGIWLLVVAIGKFIGSTSKPLENT